MWYERHPYKMEIAGSTPATSTINLLNKLDMYILRISPKAFIRQGEDNEIIIVGSPNRATTFDTIGEAMRIAAQVNESLETNKVHVFSI